MGAQAFPLGAGVGEGVGVAGAAGLGAQQATSDQRVPEQIRVPAGNRRIAVMPAQGVQTYLCTNGNAVKDSFLSFSDRKESFTAFGPR